jgi:hypothetical protein
MADGTRMDFVLPILSPIAHSQENTARTAGGQVIPEGPEQLRGKWISGPKDDLEKMTAYMQRLGAKIEHTGDGAFISSITCTPKACVVEHQSISQNSAQ